MADLRRQFSTLLWDTTVALVPEKQLEEQCEEVDGDDDQPGKLKEYENQKLRLWGNLVRTWDGEDDQPGILENNET